MRRTKLICTIGPASAGLVADLVDAGMDIARVNFSHGSATGRRRIFESVRAAAEQAGRPVEILADLSGPKIRLGPLPGRCLELHQGSHFGLGCAAGRDIPCIPTDHQGLTHDLRPGDTVFLADGRVELRVLACSDIVLTEVVQGGVIRPRAGVNVPSVCLSLPPITDKDTVDLQRALDHGADLVAQSFVRRADDVRKLRQHIGGLTPRIFAKVETRSAVEEADAILQEADGIMVARGDLGVEMPFEEIPLIQKDLIGRARASGRPGIVATQMLYSMVASPRPTRAEVSDVANAVLEGAEGILLSDETAIGRYPVAAAQAAARIVESAERWMGSSEVAGTGPETLRRLA